MPNKGNLKLNPELRATGIYISHSCDDSSNNPSDCWKMLVVDRQWYWLTDFGNLLYWYDAAKAWLSLGFAEAGAWVINVIDNKDPFKKNTQDSPLYEAGYELAQNTKGDITSELLLETLKKVYAANLDTIWNYRKAETTN